MNTPQSLPSQVRSVDFGFLSRSEIRKLSVKRITHTQAIDKELGFPIPGGLYDQALGTRGDSYCTTCDLEGLCPGHTGHIQLPAPVFHPVFLDQLLKLLNGQCMSCMKFKISSVDLHAFASKLKLVRYGLINEAQHIDEIQVSKKSGKQQTEDDEDDEDDGPNSGDSPKHLIIRERNKFMKKAIKQNGGKRHLLANPSPKVEALAEFRRRLIRDFMEAILRINQCEHCQAYSHKLRKDGYSKIFQKPMKADHLKHNIQREIRLVEPLLERASVHQAAAAKRKKKEALQDDEGIAMEVDDLSGEELDDQADIDTALDSTNLLDSAAVAGPIQKQKFGESGNTQQLITPAMAQARLEELFQEEKEILGLLYQSRPSKSSETDISPEMFFLFDILVTPNKYRPDMRTGAGLVTEAEQNKCYSDILNASFGYSDMRRDLHSAEQGTLQWARAVAGLQQSLIRMQDAVNTLIDSSKNPLARANINGPEGIKQKLEKKEGLFRMNMMGKRVNFAARSVIAPSPDLETNEIGVPPVFAMKLTYPESVTDHNFYEMKQAVLNGPDKWPGAAAIENENGQLVNLRYKNFEERQALANQLLAPSSTNTNGSRNKRVHRHLNNGDMLIANRQPSLHKPSMMCHRARVMKGERTIRLHYANANTYNADFDGDEMNLHFPQSEAARAEAILIADTDHQFLSGTAGKPLRGLIQDHLSMAVWLCNKDTFFTREDYHQLLYSCLRPEETGKNIITVPPVIQKPRTLWSGKQIITTLLVNIKPAQYPGLTMSGKSNVPTDRWHEHRNDIDKKQPGEGEVMFKDGELLCGILDKSQIGPSKGGFVHSIYEVYGHTAAGVLLSILGRMLTRLENMRAFSCGMEDIVFTEAGNKRRRELLKDSSKVGHEVATKYVSLEASVPRTNSELLGRLEGVLRDDKKQQGLDTVYNSRTKDLSSGITKGCLPSGLFKPFPRNQMQTMTISGAKGSGVNANLISCNLGQQVLEGRRTPTMVSGKTLPAFKPFETSIRAGGYITNRFLTGVQPQEYYFHTMAGREGLIDTAVKTSRSGYLQRCIIKGMEGLQVEYDTTVRDSDGSVVQFLYGEDGLDVAKQVQLQNFKFQAENFMSAAYNSKIFQMPVEHYREEISEGGQKVARKFAKTDDLAIADPTLALWNPSSTWGCTSEKFATGLKKYIKENPQRLIKDKKDRSKEKISKRDFQMLMEMMYQHAIIEPGEPVGIVAGQSIGEPSTQMTLNTFHLAGHSAKNVTLGIPRLRELLMTATERLATPQMKLYLNSDISTADGAKFAKGLSKRTVADVVDQISVTERIGDGIAFPRSKMFDIRFDFFPAAEYRDTYAITEEDLAGAIENEFIPLLMKAIKKDLKSKGLAPPEIGNSAGSSETEKVKSGTSGDAAEDSGRKEQARTDDLVSEDSDEDDEPDEDKPEQGGKAYDEDEDDQRIADKARENSVESEAQDPDHPPHRDEGYAGSNSEHEDSSDSDDDLEGKQSERRTGAGKVSSSMAEARAARILKGENAVAKFKWDTKKGQWCEMMLEYGIGTDKILMLNLIEEASRKAVVQYIEAVESATIDSEKLRNDETGEEQDVATLVVEGNNLVAMHDYQAVIDPHRIFSNDVVAMMNVYGVEAGRATLIREMSGVFEGHGIAVDQRHLSLIADHMTRNGDYLAFSRLGLKSTVSPFSKMSFETTVAFLRDAVMESDVDTLRGPSARIVTGLPGKVGTGAFDVLTPLV